MIKLPEPAGYRLRDTEASEHYAKEIHVYYDLCDFKEGVDPTKYVDGLQKLYTEDQLKQAILDALDKAACLFSQDHVEYFGDEVRATILKLKEEMK